MKKTVLSILLTFASFAYADNRPLIISGGTVQQLPTGNALGLEVLHVATSSNLAAATASSMTVGGNPVFTIAGGGLESSGNTVQLLSSCSTNQVLKWNGSAWACSTQSGGITNGAGANVITKSDGTNLVASSATDDGTTFAIATNKLTVTEASGNTAIAGTIGVTGLSTLTGGFTLGADSSANTHKITNLTNGAAAQDAAAFGQIATAVNAAVNGTNTDLAIYSSAHVLGNYAGSSPSACTTGQAVTTSALSAAGGLTATCTTLVSGTNNTTTKFTGTNTIGNAWALDDGTSWGVSGKFLITEASGNTTVSGTLASGTHTVTGAETVSTTLGVTGLSTLTGGFDSSAGPATVGKLSGKSQTSSVTGTNNDFNISATTTTLVWSGGSTGTFTGFQCGGSTCSSSNDQQLLLLVNTSASSSEVVKHESASSVAGNRIDLPGTQQHVLLPNEGMLLQYDGPSLRWHAIGWASTRIDAPFELVSTVQMDSSVTIGSGLTLQSSGGLNISSSAGHIRSTGAIVVPTSCGTTPTVNNSTDIAGHITIGAGGTGCTVPWGVSYTNPPACTFDMEGAAAGTFTSSATALTVTAASGGTFDYFCVGLI